MKLYKNYIFQIILICALLCRDTVVIAQTVARGIVFEDNNRNRKQDNNEHGIRNVNVSNGKDVAATDSQGRYQLSIDSDDILFVIKPSGYMTLVDDMNLPKFYYIHKPKGSPTLKYPAVAPTGKLPSSIDFPLYKQIEPDTFRILVFGDPQPRNDYHLACFDQVIISEVAGIKNVPFGISVGDLTEDIQLGLLKPYNRAIKKIGIPWYNVLGNHDLNGDAQADTLADETFEAHYGPSTYAFNYGKVHFIILDNVTYPKSKRNVPGVRGFRQDQLEFVKNSLRYVPKDHLVVLSFHVPLFEYDYWGDTFDDESRKQLFAVLKDFPHTLSLSAHNHTQTHYFHRKKDGWVGDSLHHEYNVGTTSGDWYSGEPDKDGIVPALMSDGTPKGYATVTFKGNKYELDYRVAGKPDTYRMRLYAPNYVIKDDPYYSGHLFANVFMGNEKTQVDYRLNGGEWKPMKLTPEIDPWVAALRYEWFTRKEPPKGYSFWYLDQCRHLWKESMPANLPVGKHTIEVRAKDMFGRESTDRITYQVIELNQKITLMPDK